jgi:ATP-dependent Clp protease protease subunit
MVIQAREILKVRERLAQVVSEETGQSLIKVMADMERDYWMTAAEAIDYGIVSRIVRTHNDV